MLPRLNVATAVIYIRKMETALLEEYFHNQALSVSILLFFIYIEFVRIRFYRCFWYFFILLFNVFRRFLFLLRNWFRVHLWRKMIKIYIFWIIGTNIFHILEKSLGNNFPTLATGPSTSYVITLVKSGNFLINRQWLCRLSNK